MSRPLKEGPVSWPATPCTSTLQAGIPAERFTVSWEVGGPAVCRRTDFRLLDAHGSEVQMRQKAEDLMKRIFSEQLKAQQRENCEEKHADCPHPESMLGPTDPTEAKQALVETTTSKSQRQAKQSSVAGCFNASPPTVSLEVSGQQVRLVFKKVGWHVHEISDGSNLKIKNRWRGRA